jgi:hypothetical protein
VNNSYYRRHNPLIDFTDVCPGTGQDMNSVPYTQMATDFAQGNTVNFAYIAPDSDEDAHNGSLPAADLWLQNNVPAILARPEFGPGGDGILFIVWDEGTLYTDNRCSASIASGCGGRTANLVIGPQVKPGYQSTTTYHNENVLMTACAALGLSPCPGAAQNAMPMADFFKSSITPGTPSNSIVISSPGNGASIVGTVHVLATASEDQPVSQTQVWDNGAKLGEYGNQIDAVYTLSPGTHTTIAIDLDASYRVIHQASVTYSVQPLVNGLQIVSPTQGETISSSTVHVVAHAGESVPVSQMQIWDNGVRLGWYAGGDVNQYFNLASGTHVVTVFDLDGSYKVIHQASVTYTVQAAPSGVQIVSPAPGQAFSMSAVHIVAQSRESVPVSQMQVWDNRVKLGWYAGSSVDQTFSLAPGSHTVTVLDLDANFNVIHQSSVPYSVQ